MWRQANKVCICGSSAHSRAVEDLWWEGFPTRLSGLRTLANLKPHVVAVAGAADVAVGFLPRRRAHAAKPLDLRIG
jgi:hypothetical protein